MNPTTHKNVFESKQEYDAFVARWKALARAKHLTAADCLLRCLLLGQDLERVMPVTCNTVRLANGAAANSGRMRAAYALKNADPIRELKTRQDWITRLQQQGRSVPEYLTQPTWSQGWVDPLHPESVERGLSMRTLGDAAKLAAGVRP